MDEAQYLVDMVSRELDEKYDPEIIWFKLQLKGIKEFEDA